MYLQTIVLSLEIPELAADREENAALVVVVVSDAGLDGADDRPSDQGKRARLILLSSSSSSYISWMLLMDKTSPSTLIELLRPAN